MNHKMKYELLQPWSTFVLKTQLPPPILEKMLKITDEIIVNTKPLESGLTGSGQMKDEFYVEPEIFNREGLMEFFLNQIKQFIKLSSLQASISEKQREQILNDKWYAKIGATWIISMKDHEYQPIHAHSGSHVSSVMYLKIPEYLPSKNPTQNEDGAITFISPLGQGSMTIQPEVGDFFLFPATQQHLVYPFRTADGNGERRSLSFNATVSTSMQDLKNLEQFLREAI